MSMPLYTMEDDDMMDEYATPLDKVDKVEHFTSFSTATTKDGTPIVVTPPSQCPSAIRIMLTLFISAALVQAIPSGLRASIEALVPTQLGFLASPVAMGSMTVIVYALISFMTSL